MGDRCQKDGQYPLRDVEDHDRDATPGAGGPQDVRSPDVAAAGHAHINAGATGEQERKGHGSGEIPEQDRPHHINGTRSSGSYAAPRGDSDMTRFVELLHSEPWLLGEPFVEFQTEIVDRAALHGRGEFIAALLDMDPAILRQHPPPRSQAIEFAFTYAKTHLLPVLTRIWPLPDDLPHAAGMGYLARVKRWFDESGAPALGDVEQHYPSSPYMPKDRVEEYAGQWATLS